MWNLSPNPWAVCFGIDPWRFGISWHESYYFIITAFSWALLQKLSLACDKVYSASSCTNTGFCPCAAFPFLLHSQTSNCYWSLSPLTNSLALVMFVSPGHGSVRSSVARHTNTWLVHCPVCFLGLYCQDHYTVWVKYFSRCPGNVQIPVQSFSQAVKSLCTHWTLYAYEDTA